MRREATQIVPLADERYSLAYRAEHNRKFQDNFCIFPSYSGITIYDLSSIWQSLHTKNIITWLRKTNGRHQLSYQISGPQRQAPLLEAEWGKGGGGRKVRHWFVGPGNLLDIQVMKWLQVIAIQARRVRSDLTGPGGRGNGRREGEVSFTAKRYRRTSRLDSLYGQVELGCITA